MITRTHCHKSIDLRSNNGCEKSLFKISAYNLILFSAYSFDFFAAPEGFDAPVLYVVSATSIRVSWTAPRTPNGIINNYTIVGLVAASFLCSLFDVYCILQTYYSKVI